ncbi:hypothetical protein FHS25_005185 [Rhizobium laguerreae]|uniref:Uncharacterized protein n=1 Tax=Rhizobium laguerreae TaxID=1076926 RepID=A0ABR6GEH0_9HYPH|nr:hypothetical protein [Rhizobium laguerreae]MBB3164682.1 hypothetical protein [Rhizobium laguerreae]OOO46406.1 hypothetical protein BS630_25460 [Rhizobium laguerreae]
MVNSTSVLLQPALGDWASQNRQGREMADALVQRMISEENPLLLGRMLSSFYSGGEHAGVKTGFVQQLAEKLMTSRI